MRCKIFDTVFHVLNLNPRLHEEQSCNYDRTSDCQYSGITSCCRRRYSGHTNERTEYRSARLPCGSTLARRACFRLAGRRPIHGLRTDRRCIRRRGNRSLHIRHRRRERNPKQHSTVSCSQWGGCILRRH